jgi:CRISPR system Cascade subunit CasA
MSLIVSPDNKKGMLMNPTDECHVERRFNLIDEPWIPVAGVGHVSLRQLFSQPSNPVQKIAVTKLLLAIAQAAYTPVDDDDWVNLGSQGLAEKCLDYLDTCHDRFYLYGDRPFLQIPAIRSAKIQSFGAVSAEVSTGNTTILTQSQKEKPLSDADKALLIVQLMGFALGGKKTDNSIVLSPGYQGKTSDNGKPSTGSSGTSIGFMGFLHNFLAGESLQETLWLNLLTQEQVDGLGVYPLGVGSPPWRQMPSGETCPIAEVLKSSLIGRLLPVSRFCLLSKDGLHYSEGIAHPGYADGVVDPSVAVDFTPKKPKVIWVDPERRPWRFLTALLSFFSKSTFNCEQLRLINRVKGNVATIGIWSGGLRVSSNAGEQFLSGSDDYVESLIQLNTAALEEEWLSRLQNEMDELNNLASKAVYGSVMRYLDDQKMEGKAVAGQASNLFWQLCERRFQEMVLACDTPNGARLLRPAFAAIVNKVYDTYCPKDTARQIEYWAKNRPNLGKYLHNPNKESA